MKKSNKIPTILGIIILVIGTFAGVFFLNMNQVFRIGADSASSPKDIRIGNLSDNSATVSWITDKESVDFLVWGESQSSLNKIEKESQTDQKFFTHSITLSGLKPGTTYYYKINSDGVNYDNKGIPWQLTTGPTLNSSPNSINVSGSVISGTGLPAQRALVYITVNGYLISTLTSESGNYVFQLGIARTPNLGAYTQIDPHATLLEISVSTGPSGVASASIFPESAKPVPPIILGQVLDFRNLKPNQNNGAPDANLNLPENATIESKFNVEQGIATPSSTTVILESLKDGETVTSTQPQFFGKGPGGEKITILVESENPITDEVQIPKTGSWNWSPPTGLTEGAHKVTISWIDSTGITRSLTRNFIVQAGELPAFVATPSQSLATPTTSGSGTPLATASPSPKPVATVSAAPVPVTGSTYMTVLMYVMGIIVLGFSFFIWRLSEN